MLSMKLIVARLTKPQPFNDLHEKIVLVKDGSAADQKSPGYLKAVLLSVRNLSNTLLTCKFNFLRHFKFHTNKA